MPYPFYQLCSISVSGLISEGSTSAVVTFQEDQTTEELHKVYGQLGQLSSLKSSVLCSQQGVTHHPDARTNRSISSEILQAEQFRCASLSPKSGLDQLSGLKALRILNVSKMARKIGVAELEWIREN